MNEQDRCTSISGTAAREAPGEPGKQLRDELLEQILRSRALIERSQKLVEALRSTFALR